jgi:hypothetical protein
MSNIINPKEKRQIFYVITSKQLKKFNQKKWTIEVILKFIFIIFK